MIKAVCLDLGNVLIRFDYRRFFQRIARNSPLSEEQIEHRFQESQLHGLYESGKILSRNFYVDLCSDLQATIGYEDFCDSWSSIFNRKANVKAPFLHSLARNYTLVLLSNTNEIHFSFLTRNFLLLRAFHHFALSYQVGVKKPGTGIYEAALKLTGVRPKEVFYADDIEEYVAAGSRMGLCTARVSTGDELMAELIRQGVQTTVLQSGSFRP